jgi:hypothetical protein
MLPLFNDSTEGRSNIIGMSLTSLSSYGNNISGRIKSEESSAYIANMKMLNQFILEYSPRHSHQQRNPRSFLQQKYQLQQPQQLCRDRLQPNSTNPNHPLPLDVPVNLQLNFFPESNNNFPDFSDVNPNEIEHVIQRDDCALHRSESLDIQGCNTCSSCNISEWHHTAPSPDIFHYPYYVEDKTEDHDTLFNQEDATTDTSTNENRFRHYQADKWTTMLEELLEFRRQHNHCNVPHTSKVFPTLGRWVKRQRYQYKLMLEGKKNSTMTLERAAKLEQIGFVWDAHSSTWHRRLQELHDFFFDHGHCNVPSNFPSNPQLSTWVKFQRRQYHALQKRNQTNKIIGQGVSGQSLTPSRIRALEELGFQWELRRNRSVK